MGHETGCTRPVSGWPTMARASQDDSYEREVSVGLASLVSLAKCLAHEGTDPDKHEKIKGHCRDALGTMKAAEKALEAHRSALSDRIGEGHVQMKELADEQKQKATKLSQLEIQKENCEQTYFRIQDQVTVAETHLQELTTLLRKARREEKCFKALSNITLVLLPLYSLLVSMKFFQEALQVTDTQPLFLSASIVTIICQVSMWVAQKAGLELQKAIDQYQVQVSDYRKEGYACDKEKAEIKEKIEVITAGQEKIKEASDELGKLLKVLQEKTLEMEKHKLFVRKLTEKVDTLETYIDDPSDYDFATIVLEEINQLVLSEVGKGGQGSLGFTDKEAIKKMAEELNHVAQKLKEGKGRNF
ncbi:uncharacterized protein LOC102458609 [Pelodiscus sinensis]|uniref:uncharacterized protein LOC102458609 n=1 Tax=Pelodiscus sinensis TaxID=13735 RepID=UPI003F6B931B